MGILLMAQRPLVRAEPGAAAHAPLVDAATDANEAGDSEPGQGAGAPVPLTLRDGVPSAMLDRLRSSSVARAAELISANRGAAVACGSPDPAAGSTATLSDAVETAAWRLLALRSLPVDSAPCDSTFLPAPRDPSVATAIFIHGPPALPA